MIADNLRTVRSRIAKAAEAAKRDPASITLLCVSKKHPAAAIREAYAAGERDFGENYAQELAEKSAELAHELPEARFHMIGHVQTNKAKIVAEHAYAIHSVDSVRLVNELQKRRASAAQPLRVIVEVNVSGESSKSGATASDVGAILDATLASPQLTLVGLMTMPPFGDLKEAERLFRALATLREEHGGAAKLPELSMGMSDDMDVAIACGATIVRVGTAIFGGRS